MRSARQSMVSDTVDIQFSKVHIVAVATLVFAGVLYTATGEGVPFIDSHDHGSHVHSHDNTATVSGEMTLRDRFDMLRVQSTNACGAQPQHLTDIPDGQRMQGSCCSAMNFHSYEEQIAGLESDYSDYGIIPSDPYNVSVKWAKQMIKYGEDTELTEGQQAIYDKATEISHEGGPCCCKCWHWYAYAGLGKKLIIDHDFSAAQLAELWELSDACGGDHTHT